MGYLRDLWTEEDILSLPEDEQDYFERKAGSLLASEDWRQSLAKSFSAFANSGGGHIIVGQSNDRRFDGIEPEKDRTPIAHWFEQIIPNLLIYPLKSFRVHIVRPKGGDSKIPTHKVVVVIDIDDSPQAPHQAAVPKDKPIYYYRTGSDSKVAPHHYLEALRTRFVGARLTVTYEGIGHIKFCNGSDQPIWQSNVMAEVVLRFKIENVSRQACYKWVLDWDLPKLPANRPIVEPPQFKSSYPSLRETQDEVILPSRHVEKLISIGIPIAQVDETNGIWWLMHDTHIRYRAISEHYVPDFKGGQIADHKDRLLLGDQFRLDLEEFRGQTM